MKKVLVFLVSFVVAFGAFAADYNADSLSQGYSYNSGRVVAKYFTHNTGAVAHTNDTIMLAIIPEYCRVIGGTVTVSAMGGAQTFADILEEIPSAAKNEYAVLVLTSTDDVVEKLVVAWTPLKTNDRGDVNDLDAYLRNISR